MDLDGYQVVGNGWTIDRKSDEVIPYLDVRVNIVFLCYPNG